MRVELTLAEPQSAVPPQHFGPLVGVSGNAPLSVGYQPTALTFELHAGILDGVTGNAPASPPWQRGALAFVLHPEIFLAGVPGLEPG